MKVTIIVPTLNEFRAMQQVMPHIRREWYDQLIVLDGNSKDGTLDWAIRQGYDVYTQKKRGMWNAYTELFNSGYIRGDVIVTFSPDGNSVPQAIPRLIRKIEAGYDMVIASRYMHGAMSYDDSWITKLGNHMFTGLANLPIGINYTDALVMFRAFKRDLVDKLDLAGEIPKLYGLLQRISGLTSWEVSLSIRAGKNRYRVAEIPADEPPNISLSGRRRQNIWQHGSVILAQILYEGWFRRGICDDPKR